jgi:RimJ/RimL family protein N-acetyltransferase
MNIYSATTRNIADFNPIVSKLQNELGERFPISIQNWCGIGQRPYPLKNWNVFIGRDKDRNTDLGIYSYYQQQDDPSDKFWIGWIGVVSSERRKGIATKFIELILCDIKDLGARSLWVHTDNNNKNAIALYKSVGMNIWGDFSNTGAQQASASENTIVLWMKLQ